MWISTVFVLGFMPHDLVAVDSRIDSFNGTIDFSAANQSFSLSGIIVHIDLGISITSILVYYPVIVDGRIN